NQPLGVFVNTICSKPSLQTVPGDRKEGVGIITRGQKAWAIAKLGAHHASIYADFSLPERGGQVIIDWVEWGEEGAIVSGSLHRLELLAGLFAKYGFYVHVNEKVGSLQAIFDKNHGAPASIDELKKTFQAAVSMLASFRDFDLIFGGNYRHLLNLGFAPQIVDLWEGYFKRNQSGYPLQLSRIVPDSDNWYQIASDFDQKVRIIGEWLFPAINDELNKLGLENIEDVDEFGNQVVKERLFKERKEAETSGRFKRGEDGELALDDTYEEVKVVKEFSQMLMDLEAGRVTGIQPGYLMYIAELVEYLEGSRQLNFYRKGTLGNFRVDECTVPLKGENHTFYVLRFRDTGKVLFGVAVKGDKWIKVNGRDANVENKLGKIYELLKSEGYTLVAELADFKMATREELKSRLAELTALAKDEEVEKRFPIYQLGTKGIEGGFIQTQIASPGKVFGIISIDTPGKKDLQQEWSSKIYVPGKGYIAPDDTSKASKAAGAIADSGATNNHANITLRREGFASVIGMGPHQMVVEGNVIRIKCNVPSTEDVIRGNETRTIRHYKEGEVVLRDGDLVMIDASEDSSDGVVVAVGKTQSEEKDFSAEAKELFGVLRDIELGGPLQEGSQYSQLYKRTVGRITGAETKIRDMRLLNMRRILKDASSDKTVNLAKMVAEILIDTSMITDSDKARRTLETLLRSLDDNVRGEVEEFIKLLFGKKVYQIEKEIHAVLGEVGISNVKKNPSSTLLYSNTEHILLEIRDLNDKM
ncbi:MAG: hypothetical protein WBD12_07275, partial [Candidatus Omnitrophota bacterium]